jgi:hypothetical protein
MTAFVLLDTDSVSEDDESHAMECKLTDTKHCSVTVRGFVERTYNPRVPGIDPLHIDWPG